jgi:L-histidine N-alpha-methyltransferase
MRDAGCLETYVPIDISEEITQQTAEMLVAEYPGLKVRGLVCDFEHHLERIHDAGERRLIAFLGGTIGNLAPAERAVFLASVRAMMAPEDTFLLGTDLVKDEATLVAAYDDAQGVTAAFNKNVLSVIDRELGADFDPDDFDHIALWDRENEWIEMRLRARQYLTVKIPALDLTADFAPGEEMRTEISAKFREPGVRAELTAAGLELRHWWTDRAGRFALSLASPVARER